MSKFLILLSVALAALALGLLQHSKQATIEALEKSQDRGQLRWLAKLAKAKGENTVVFPGSKIHYAVPRSLERALAVHDLVVVEVISSKSFAEDTDRDIETWYKLRLIEKLSAHTEECLSCPSSSSPPSEMLPLNKDEFLISRVGGEISIDGVNVVSIDSEFPPFQSGKRYLLFVSFDPQQMVAALRMGPWGTFAVGADDKLQPINLKLKHGLRSDLASRFNDSVPNLRMDLKKVL